MQRRFQTAAIHRLTLSGGQPRALRIVLAAQNSTGIPAVVHFDGTARVQCVTQSLNPQFYRLLSEFKKLSGFGALLNTSFNIQEPIVCTPLEAIRTFSRSSMDCLSIGNYLVRRRAN